MRTKIAALCLFVAMTTAIGVACRHATADALPNHMEPVDAARLQASLAELGRIESETKTAAAPHRARAQEILQRYKIDPSALGNTVGIDFESGEIKRKEPAAKP